MTTRGEPFRRFVGTRQVSPGRGGNATDLQTHPEGDVMNATIRLMNATVQPVHPAHPGAPGTPA